MPITFLRNQPAGVPKAGGAFARISHTPWSAVACRPV